MPSETILKRCNLLRARAAIFIFCLFLTVSSSGCAFVAGGIVGIAGGYMLAHDTITGEYAVKYKEAWKASLDACSTLGDVNEQDYDEGVILAVIDGVSVRVTVAELSDKSSSIKVKARKACFPQIGTAEKVFVKIAQKLPRQSR